MTQKCWSTTDNAKCTCSETSGMKLQVQYLYLDMQTCDRCIGTDEVLDEVMEVLTPALNLAGFDVEYDKVEMSTEEMAREYRFLSSPTIRVNGEDLCQAVVENSCGCCSDISGTDVDCRVFVYKGEAYEVPPKEMLALAILEKAFGSKASGCECGEYELPENLKTFYEGKKIQQRMCECSCSCNQE